MEEKKPIDIERAIQYCGEYYERLAKEMHDELMTNYGGQENRVVRKPPKPADTPAVRKYFEEQNKKEK